MTINDVNIVVISNIACFWLVGMCIVDSIMIAETIEPYVAICDLKALVI